MERAKFEELQCERIAKLYERMLINNFDEYILFANDMINCEYFFKNSV